MEDEIRFEAAVETVERIVADLERGQIELGTSLAKYEEAVKLLGHCQSLIDRTERAVSLLTGVDESGRAITSPFDAKATVAEAESAPIKEKKPKRAKPAVAEPAPVPEVSPAPVIERILDIEPPF